MTDTNVTTQKSKLPFKFKVEPRLKDAPGWYSPLLSLAAVVVALLIGALVIRIGGSDPWKAYSHIANPVR